LSGETRGRRGEVFVNVMLRRRGHEGKQTPLGGAGH